MSDRPDWDREGRDWPNRDASRSVTAGDVRWHVQVAGSGPVLLLLHGTGAATHSWRALLPLLAEHFTVVAPDLPGHGFTSAGPKALPAMATAVTALLAEVDLKPAIVTGHSAGAAVGLRMVLDRQVTPAGVVALSPALLPFPGLAAQLFPTLAKMLFLNTFAPHIFARMAGPLREVERFMAKSTGSKIDAAGVDGYARLFRKPGHIRGTISMMANWDLEPLKRDLERLTIPLLIIHGDNDVAIPITKAREAAALMSRVQFETMAGAGHLAHEERPDEVAQMIKDFAACGTAASAA